MTAAPTGGTRTSSLRLRVVVAVLVLLAVVLVGLGTIVNAVLGDRLRSDLHQRLVDRAGLAQVLGAGTQNLSDQQLANRLTGQGITASVNQVPGTEDPGQQGPPNGPGKPPRPTPTAAVTVQQSGELLRSSFTVDGRRVQLSTSLADVDHALRTLRGVELAAGAVTLVIVALVLVWVVGAALAPLDRMTRLALRTRDGARGRRLRPTRPNTDIGRTAVAFDDMLDALETAEAQARLAEERMRQFLADASHDLRTPVAGVIATAERVLREDPGRAVREERLVALIREARRAARLVDDVVLMSRLDADQQLPGQTDPVDLAALAEAVAARSEDVRVHRAGPAVVWGDHDRLQRALVNLVDNARRHASRGVDVSTSVGDGAVVLDVTDDGPGIAEADRERVFDRFVRLDHHRGGPGSGLGLPIARAITVAHGGSLVCLARADGLPGARFRITLPQFVAGPGGGPVLLAPPVGAHPSVPQLSGHPGCA